MKRKIFFSLLISLHKYVIIYIIKSVVLMDDTFGKRGVIAMLNFKKVWNRVEMGKRNLAKEKHWENLFVENYGITKPTIICLGGNATIDTFEANGFCKLVENMLGLIKRGSTENISDRVDLLGFGYARKNSSDEVGELPNDFVENFVDSVMIPLFSENGERLSLDEAKRNMSKISFFTYCHGQVEANKIIETLDLRLADLGYNEGEINDINSATVNVSFAPLDDRANYMPTLRVLSIRDERVGKDVSQVLSQQELASLDGVIVRTDDAGKIYGTPREHAISGSINVISSQLLNAINRIIDEHLASILSRDNEWHIREFANSEGDLVVSSNADCISQIMSYVLGLAIENGEKNMYSESYIPNTFYTTLPEEIDSIISGFTKSSLQAVGQKRWEEREVGYNAERWKKLNNWSKNYYSFAKPESVVFSELKQATSFIQVASILETNNYNYLDDVFDAIQIPLSNSEKTLIKCGAKNREINRGKRKWQCEPDAVINLALSKAQTLDEIASILNCFDYANARRFANILLGRADNNYPITISEIESILKPIKQEFASRPEKVGRNEYFRLMVDEVQSVKADKDSFYNIAQILEKYDYYSVTDAFPYLQDKLSKEERDAIMGMRRAKILGEEARMGQISCLKFSEMVDLLNSAESFEDVISRYSRYGFCGAKYVLPEIVVLDDDEKAQILEMECVEQ